MRAKIAISTPDAASAAIILVFGLFLFSIQDIIIKHFSSSYSVLQIVFIRGLIALGLFAIFFKITSQKINLRSRRPGLMLARGLLGFSSYTSYYLAVAAMPLAEVVAIAFTMPLIVTAMSALLLREKVGVRRWSAVVIGLLGVLIILSPSGEFNSLAVVFAFVAAFTYASQAILTRFLGDHDHPLAIAYHSILIFTLVSGLVSLLLLSGLISIASTHPSLAFFGRAWNLPTDIDMFLLLVIGFIAAVGFYCLSKAYCSSVASAIAPFEFTYILWAVVFGFLFWNEVPGPTTILGVLVLISSSLYIWYRERQVRRGETALVPLRAAEMAQQDSYSAHR